MGRVSALFSCVLLHDDVSVTLNKTELFLRVVPSAGSLSLAVALPWIQLMTSHLIAWEMLVWFMSTHWWVIYLSFLDEIFGYILKTKCEGVISGICSHWFTFMMPRQLLTFSLLSFTGRGEVHIHREVWKPSLSDAAGEGTQQTHPHTDQRCCQGWFEGSQERHRRR